MGIGVDIVKIDRFKNVSQSFINRVFTECELEYLQNKPVQTMAGIFAAKEAVSKALGTGFRGIEPRDIEILHNNFGKPYVRIKKKKRRLCLQVSISHNETDAVAVCYFRKRGAK